MPEGAGWLVLGLAATCLWGVGYVSLKSAGPVSPFVVMSLLGACNLVSGLVGIAAQAVPELNTRPLLFVFGYIACSLGASYCYQFAAQMPDVHISILVAITGCYPLVTALLSFLLLKEWTNVHPYLAVPGLALTLTGTALLAVAKK